MFKALVLLTLLAVSPVFIKKLDPPKAEPVLKGMVFFAGDVDESTLTAVKNELGATGTDHVTLVITSPGGNVLAGLLFIQDVERMKRAKPALRIRCIGDIVVASMAAVILESDICDTRLVTNRTVVVFHGVQAPPSPLKTALDFSIAQFVAPRLGMTPEAYLTKLAGGDWVMNAYEAAAAGAAESVVTHIAEDADSGTP